MMKNIYKKAIAAVLVIAVFSLLLFGCKGDRKSVTSESEEVYIIKEYHDAVYVYKNDKEIMKTRIVISSLPRTEKMKLKEGITAKSYDEVERLIELYES